MGADFTTAPEVKPAFCEPRRRNGLSPPRQPLAAHRELRVAEYWVPGAVQTLMPIVCARLVLMPDCCAVWKVDMVDMSPTPYSRPEEKMRTPLPRSVGNSSLPVQ